MDRNTDYGELYSQIKQRCQIWQQHEEARAGENAGDEHVLSVVMLKPTCFEDGVKAAMYIKQRQRLILNMESLAPEDSRRMLDFVFGAALIQDYSIQQISANAFILACKGDVMTDSPDFVL